VESELEIEVKIRMEDAGQRLQAAGLPLEEVLARHFEENWLLDTPDERLSGQGVALRLRTVGNRTWVTYKGRVQTEANFKVREELETTVADGDILFLILERLGFQRKFLYQKWRTVYRLSLFDGTTVLAMVDETPMGAFLELEGARAGIMEVAKALGVGTEDFITKGYPSLQAEACQQRGQPLANMVF